MAREESVILTNMCMVYKDDKILVQNRVNKDWPGISFPGGHIEENESFVKSTIREVYEETGLTISNLELCGIKQWTNFDGQFRYIAILYKTSSFSGQIKSSSEGEVFWIDRDKIYDYNLSDGFRDSLEVFFDDRISETYYYFEDDQWKVENL